MIEQIFFNNTLLALIPAIAGILLGFAAEWIILRQASKFASKTKWEFDDVLISSLKHMIFPWFILGGIYFGTRPLSLTNEQQTILDRTLQVSIIILVTALVARISVAIVRFTTKTSGGTMPSATLFSNITKIIVFAGGALMLLQAFGISITPMLTALGVGGLAVALALQDTLGNLFSGIQILATRKIKPGDYISLDSGQEGYVTDITWRNTTIRTLPNTLIIVPNSKISSASITNYHLPQKDMAVLVQVGVSYDSDLSLVEKTTIEVAKEVMKTVTGGVPEFEPFIRYHTFADFSINFSVIMRGKEFVDQYLIKHEFIKLLHKRYCQEGIEIPFPIRTLKIESDLKMAAIQQTETQPG